MTISEEKYILDRFKTCYQLFPKGEIHKSEQPDYIIKSTKKIIGIEITEVFQDSHQGYSKYQQRSSDRHDFSQKLILELQKVVNFTFLISIHFSDFYHLRKSKEKEKLEATFKATINHLMHLDNKQSILIEDFRRLPQEIDSVRIVRYDGLDESYDEKPDGGVVSDMTDIHINSVISKKEEKLIHYQDCNEHWLLIKEGNYYAGTFSDIKINSPIISNFDKIFLFRINKSEIIVLK